MTVTNVSFNRLIGTWQNKIKGEWHHNLGWNIITQPKLGVSSHADFAMRFDQLEETITFKEIGQARNVGITGEAGFWQSLAYEGSVKNSNGVGIHHEMGHFLLHVLESGETAEELRGDIIRQATIPRANAMMTLGELRPEGLAFVNTADNNAFYAARPISKDPQDQAIIDAKFQNLQAAIFELNGPALDKPLDWLSRVMADNPLEID